MMPRHRKESGPRHTALHQEGGSGRSVLPRVGDFGPAFGGDAGRALAPAERRPRLRLARSLLATPWFAAGAGIVIAAVLAVDSPTALTYGPTDPGEQCPIHGCGNAPSPGQPATATPGVQLKAPGTQMKGGGSAPARPSGPAASGDRLGYQIVRRWRSGFVSVITIPGVARTGAWRLRFGFRSAHVDRVWGARWQPEGAGRSGTADGPAPWTGRPRLTRVPGQVMVSATGTPGAPSGCRLDGVRCRFG